MAIIDSPSGSSWSEIKAEINNKALNKQGDTIVGDMIVDGESGKFITDELTDSMGESAINMIPDAQTLLAYGAPINTFTLTPVSVTTSVNSDGENEAVIPMSHPARRAILIWMPSESKGVAFVNEDETQTWGIQRYHGGTFNIRMSPFSYAEISSSNNATTLSSIYIKDGSIHIKTNVAMTDAEMSYVLF